MRTEYIELSHRGPAITEGRAALAFLPRGGWFAGDCMALAHPLGWGVLTSADPEFVDLATAAGDTGVMVTCRMARHPELRPPNPPCYTLIGETGARMWRLHMDPGPGDMDAVRRVRGANELARMMRIPDDRHFRIQAIKHLYRFGIWDLPDIAAASADQTLGCRGSWVEIMLQRATEVLASDTADTVKGAELCWLTQAIPACKVWGTRAHDEECPE